MASRCGSGGLGEGKSVTVRSELLKPKVFVINPSTHMHTCVHTTKERCRLMVVSYRLISGRATFWPQVSTARANHVRGFLLVQRPHHGVFKSMDHEMLVRKGKRDRLLL